MIRPFRAIVQTYPNGGTVKLECGHVTKANPVITTRMQCEQCPLSHGSNWTWRSRRG